MKTFVAIVTICKLYSNSYNNSAVWQKEFNTELAANKWVSSLTGVKGLYSIEDIDIFEE